MPTETLLPDMPTSAETPAGSGFVTGPTIDIRLYNITVPHFFDVNKLRACDWASSCPALQAPATSPTRDNVTQATRWALDGLPGYEDWTRVSIAARPTGGWEVTWNGTATSPAEPARLFRVDDYGAVASLTHRLQTPRLQSILDTACQGTLMETGYLSPGRCWPWLRDRMFGMHGLVQLLGRYRSSLGWTNEANTSWRSLWVAQPADIPHSPLDHSHPPAGLPTNPVSSFESLGLHVTARLQVSMRPSADLDHWLSSSICWECDQVKGAAFRRPPYSCSFARKRQWAEAAAAKMRPFYRACKSYEGLMLHGDTLRQLDYDFVRSASTATSTMEADLTRLCSRMRISAPSLNTEETNA